MGELAAAGLKSLVPSHGDVLAYLFAHGEATMHELADFAHRTRPTMTVLVDKMESAGLVKREASKVDSRSTVVRLTERGEALRGAFESISSRFIEMLYTGVSEKEAETVERTLSKILSNIEQPKGKTP
ncbi:MAG: winged helix-turn-helix transcriptional regulator [Thermoguttaceae bacterium]|nr:winged helix-turn-helix transcriptional regulator [Thermoguttaceae bacterium]MCR5162860.1 MarR family winged helix-turn-helix transcriptional regulator [Thermoguttaceae bacterium]